MRSHHFLAWNLCRLLIARRVKLKLISMALFSLPSAWVLSFLSSYSWLWILCSLYSGLFEICIAIFFLCCQLCLEIASPFCPNKQINKTKESGLPLLNPLKYSFGVTSSLGPSFFLFLPHLRKNEGSGVKSHHCHLLVVFGRVTCAIWALVSFL